MKSIVNTKKSNTLAPTVAPKYRSRTSILKAPIAI